MLRKVKVKEHVELEKDLNRNVVGISFRFDHRRNNEKYAVEQRCVTKALSSVTFVKPHEYNYHVLRSLYSIQQQGDTIQRML